MSRFEVGDNHEDWFFDFIEHRFWGEISSLMSYSMWDFIKNEIKESQALVEEIPKMILRKVFITEGETL